MSIKIKTSWTDNNAIIEGVRIYKSSALFDVNTLPAVYAEITDGSLFYEDFNVIENQTYFYMLSCFLGEQEVFTECFEVLAQKQISYAALTWTGTTYTNGGTGTAQQTSLAILEPGDSTSSKILIAILSSYVAVNPPAGWQLLSSKNNVFVFWKKGTGAYTSHIFTLLNPSFVGGCMFALQPSKDIANVECVSESIVRSISSSLTPAISPVLATPISGNCFEIILSKINNLNGGNTDGSFSSGYQKIATQIHPNYLGSQYQFNLIVGGKSLFKDASVGGGGIYLTQGEYPNTLYTQTIQICAY